MGKIRLLIGLVLALAVPTTALAATSSDMQNVTLAKGDNRTGTYYAAGSAVTVDGDVAGDVVCGAQTVVINGSVGGDVLCGAQTLTINGPVAGSVRAVGQVVTVNGTVGRNITVGAQNFVLGSNAKVSGEVAIGAQTTALNAPIEHAAYIGSESLALNSTIGGNLDYASSQALSIDKSKVGGTVTWHASNTQPARTNAAADRLGMLIYWLAAALLGALLVIWLAPRLVRSVTGTMIRRWQASLGWGVLALIGGPILLLVVALTVIGLPAALVAGTLWVLALTSSGIFAGIAVGKIAWQHEAVSQRTLLLAALAGIPLVMIVGWIPWIGGLVGLVTASWVLGGMLLTLNRARALG
jgi:cytoskeletal protein CcmA (bactofilin family)